MIYLENVSKNYKIYKKEPGLKGAIKALFKREIETKIAIDNLSLKIDEGEMVGYIGSNGAGKSTTIKLMTGLLLPTSGICRTNGVNSWENRKENAKHIGVVFGQRTQLWWDLPLLDTFIVLKDLYEIKDEEYTKRLELLKEMLDLDIFINQPVRTLSLGQRMRGEVAAALIHNPKILFLDEPTIGLDVVVKEKVRKTIKRMNELYKTTVLLTTHDLTDIEELCKRIVIIDAGRKVYDGKIEDIKNQFGNVRTLEIYINEGDKILSIEKDIRKNIKLVDNGCSVWREENRLIIRFDRNKINISQLIAYIMSQYAVLDIKIKESDIESIIKRIYEHKVRIR